MNGNRPKRRRHRSPVTGERGRPDSVTADVLRTTVLRKPGRPDKVIEQRKVPPASKPVPDFADELRRQKRPEY